MIVLYRPLPHPERMAVHVADTTGVDPQLERRESKLAAFVALAVVMLLLCVGLPAAWGG